MKIGVITFHHVPNSGALLQAWSVVKLLQGCDATVSVINYRPPGLDQKFRRRALKAFVPSLGRYRQRRFVSAHLPLSTVVRTSTEVQELVRKHAYDRLVCGSDQIWMKDQFLGGVDPVYYLDFEVGRSVRKIAFAPSCGSMTAYGDDAARVEAMLSRFHALSARDRNTLQILQAMGYSNVAHVVDPTLAVDLSPLIQPIDHGRRPYLAITGRLTSEGESVVVDVAKRLRLDIIAVGTRSQVATRERKFVHPGEWLSYLAHASFVCTSLFHGTALAIHLQKPFLAFGTAGRALKLTDLLTTFGLEDRFIENPASTTRVPDTLLTCDYSSVESRVAEAKSHSLKFLRDAIHA